MAAEINAIDRPGRDDPPATRTSSNESTSMSTPTATTSVDSNANKSRDRNGQRPNGQFRGGKKGDRGRGGKRTRDFGRHEKNKGADKDKDSVDWRDRKRRKFEQDGEGGRKSGPSYMKIQFPEDEIAAEERRPKRKVAVLIGYAGTGYHGLQINHDLKTIEGDLFAAFVAAKAISKANANDPKKSSFVRCARTDKGVHAAGNMVSLKLIIEDPDIVQKINENLPPQIRLLFVMRFPMVRIPNAKLLLVAAPPRKFPRKKVLQTIKEKGLEDEYTERMGEAKDYWDEVDKTYIQPILDSLDPDVREMVKQRIHSPDRDTEQASGSQTDATKASDKTDSGATIDPKTSEGEISVTDTQTIDSDANVAMDTDDVKAAAKATTEEATDPQSKGQPKIKEQSPVEKALKEIKAAYIAAKRRYRVTPDRLEQLQQALDHYLGTKNYHNYTILKSHGDPSSKRTIKSFVVNREPIQINDTQWLSLKVHGQSFMMHQIRKMVGMAVLAVRCATPWSRFEESYSASRISIPKAPSLGLLLERPVFDTYNKRATESLNLEALSFSNHEKEIQAFKEEHIYRRIFELEEQENSVTTSSGLTSGSLESLYQREGPRDFVPKELENELGDEGENPGGEEG
ncbi:hypothetical protein RRF57_005246 [Xylaria bambusicola]|uniref:tRNA pseudouridine synthase 1 n=1 Tax=Xylaria bambusicola TaxID=326684 RepID=A0AAN7UQ70_9PEZI